MVSQTLKPKRKKKRKKKSGRHQYNKLSAAFVRSVKRPGRYIDGNGLSLLVTKTGARCWTQRLTIRGRRRDMGLGGYPVVTLAEAREAALDNKRIARRGGDPLMERRMARSIPTFHEAAEKVINLNSKTWTKRSKSAQQWRHSMETYIYPIIGENRPVNDITSVDVMSVLVPIWGAKPTTAKRIRQRISAIMSWSIANGFRQDDPAGTTVISAALPKQTPIKKHQKAIHYSEASDVLKKVRNHKVMQSAKLALEFLILTATRSGEVRLAQWREIDLDKKLWTIPAERMKAKKEHKIPLSSRAVEVLKEANQMADASGLIFTAMKYGRPLFDNTLSRILRVLNVPAVPHGFRSSFRDWAAECTETPRFVMESALAHSIKNNAEAAYARSDLIEKRRILMQSWSDYLEKKSKKIAV